MALGAGQGRRINLFQIAAQGICQIGVSYHQFVTGVGMAVIAADRLVDLRQSTFKGGIVGFEAHLIHHSGEVRGLAAEAVCQCMGATGRSHILHGVGMAAGAAVGLGKTDAFIEDGNHGIFLGVVVNFCVFPVCHVRFVDLRVVCCPFLRGLYRDTGAGLHHLDTLTFGLRRLIFGGGFLHATLAGAKTQNYERSQKQCPKFFHVIPPVA